MKCAAFVTKINILLASFPSLLHFYLLFVFTIIHRSGRPSKNREDLGVFIVLVNARWTYM